nr:SDR family NAD(P)-dependent oxidoreductase [Kineococcus vitellinus]
MPAAADLLRVRRQPRPRRPSSRTRSSACARGAPGGRPAPRTACARAHTSSSTSGAPTSARTSPAARARSSSAARSSTRPWRTAAVRASAGAARAVTFSNSSSSTSRAKCADSTSSRREAPGARRTSASSSNRSSTSTSSSSATRPLAVVTGASSGIGEQFARRYARGGFDLLLVARSGAALRVLADELAGRHGVRADVHVADLADPADLATPTDAVAGRLARVDHLVNCAGVAPEGDLADTDEETVRHLVELNVVALTLLTRAAVVRMRAAGRGGGRIAGVIAALPLPATLRAGTRDLLVRRATADDLPALIALIADDPVSAGRGDSADGTATAAYRRALHEVVDDPSNEIVVAVAADGEVVATLQLTRIPGMSRRGATRLLVEAVRVRSTRRSSGIGTALVRWVTGTAAPAVGASLVQLTSDEARTDAHRFYERLGFVGSHRGFKHAVGAQPQAR